MEILEELNIVSIENNNWNIADAVWYGKDGEDVIGIVLITYVHSEHDKGTEMMKLDK